MDAAAGDYPAGDPGASGADRDRALPGLSEAFHTGPIPAAESGQRSGQALRAAAVMPVAGPFDRRVIWVGGIVFAVLMALSPRYGFDRDELYFLDGARQAVMPGPVDVTGFGAYLYLTQFFTSVQVAATLSNPYGLHNQEWGGHVYICTGPRQPWAQIWPQLRHYS